MAKKESESKKSDGGNLVVYEIGYLILPSIPEDKLTEVTDFMREAIAKEGGIELDGEAPFRQPLAYSMSKTIGASRYVLPDAYLGWIKFEAEPSKISLIKASLEKREEILRFLLIKTRRETLFTFAKARAAIEDEKEKKEKEEKEENEEAPLPPSSEPIAVVK
jgi:ribosomal protein S6